MQKISAASRLIMCLLNNCINTRGTVMFNSPLTLEATRVLLTLTLDYTYRHPVV